MPAEPLVSIIIPCYNSEAFVGKAIDCALQQKYKNIELLLIDNNSMDGTLNILLKYLEDFPETINVLKERKQGPSAARNAGLRQARGKYVQFLDSDDMIAYEKLDQQLGLAITNNSDLVVGNYYLNNGKRKSIIANKNPWIGLVTSRLGITSSLLWKRDSLQKVAGFDENMLSSEEYDLLFRLLKSGVRIIYDSEIQTEILWRDESAGKSNDLQKQALIWDNIFDLRMRIREYLMENQMFSKEIKFAWDKYMYSHLVHLKYKFPALYQKYMPQVNYDLSICNTWKPLISRELRRILL